MNKIELSRVRLDRLPDDSGYRLEKYALTSLVEAQKLGHHLLDHYDREIFMVIGLDCHQKITVVNPVVIGNINFAVISLREVLKPLILSSAKNAIVMHNHPTGDSSPSKADIGFTKKLDDGLAVFDIKLLDHLIVGDEIYSFREGGDLDV